jgi:hypothetical protein
MRAGTFFLIALAALTILATPAGAAGRVPGGGGLPARPNPELELQRRMAPEPVKSPYAMTYSEQVAQSLGLRRDGVSLYEAREDARNSYAPSISLGGTMLRLRWRQ